MNKGVIHVGAHYGEERDYYKSLGLKVVWVEALPSVYDILCENIKGYEDQKAYNALLTDEFGKEYLFKTTSNEQASSSIFEFKNHVDMWPSVKKTSEVVLTSTTLYDLCKSKNITLADYPSLVLDTQGSELLVLKGADPILRHFKYIKTEVADFESYQDGCQLHDLQAFMASRGYKEIDRQIQITNEKIGTYYDITYIKP
jgi:FkbM family methyltransferase